MTSTQRPKSCRRRRDSVSHTRSHKSQRPHFVLKRHLQAPQKIKVKIAFTHVRSLYNDGTLLLSVRPQEADFLNFAVPRGTPLSKVLGKLCLHLKRLEASSCTAWAAYEAAVASFAESREYGELWRLGRWGFKPTERYMIEKMLSQSMDYCEGRLKYFKAVGASYNAQTWGFAAIPATDIGAKDSPLEADPDLCLLARSFSELSLRLPLSDLYEEGHLPVDDAGTVHLLLFDRRDRPDPNTSPACPTRIRVPPHLADLRRTKTVEELPYHDSDPVVPPKVNATARACSPDAFRARCVALTHLYLRNRLPGPAWETGDDDASASTESRLE